MIAIVTDSTVYLTKAEATEMGVHIVPMSYSAEGRALSESYADTSGWFQRVVTGFNCTTSQPSVAAFSGIFEELKAQGYQILCPVISSRLSGAYNGALLAGRDVDMHNIRIVDSRTTACGLRFLVEEAVRLVRNGLTLEEIALTIEKLRDKITLVFSVESMEPLRRSGRLGFIRQSVSTVLNVRPIMLCKDGTVVSHDFAKGQNQRLSKLLSAVPENVKRLAVQHLGAGELVETLTAMVREKFPDVPLLVSNIGPVLAIHLGVPSIGIGWQME